MSRMKPISAAFVAVLLASCAVHRVKEQRQPPASLPATFSDGGMAVTPDQWWQVFNDTSLNQLTEQTLASNLDMRMAWARLKQFEALAIRAGAARFPEITGNAGGQRAKTNFFGQIRTTDNYELSLGAAYEVDLWGRVRALERAGLMDQAASRQDLEALAWTLSASVASTWYNLVEQRELLSLLDEQTTVNRKILEVIETRYTNGLASAVEVYQQREQLASVLAQVPPARNRQALLSHQLAVLQGLAPTSPPPRTGIQLPELPALPQTGLPLDLLQERPDVQAAALAVTATDYRLGAAIANRYPALRLNAGAGYQTLELSDLFSNWIWNLAANIAGPIFDGGARKAEAERNRALLEERLAAYEKVVLIAIREVEDALVSEGHQRELIARLAEQTALARSALEAAQMRYASGVGNFLTVLTEIQAVQRAERSLIAARSGLVGNRIELYRALGGDWTTQLEPPQTVSQLGADE